MLIIIFETLTRGTLLQICESKLGTRTQSWFLLLVGGWVVVKSLYVLQEFLRTLGFFHGSDNYLKLLIRIGDSPINCDCESND